MAGRMSQLDDKMEALKEQLVTMASHAETSVHQALRALLRRDDDLARRTREEDTQIDRLEVQIDEAVHDLLSTQVPQLAVLRRVTTAMKIAHDLERVGDEATTISRRVIELGREPQLRQVEMIPRMAQMALDQLKEAIDCFVAGDSSRARELIPRDRALDQLNRNMLEELRRQMSEQGESVHRALALLVIARSLERIGDHAANIAEMVVYMCEGHDIRHGGGEKPTSPQATGG